MVHAPASRDRGEVQALVLAGAVNIGGGEPANTRIERS